MTGNYENMGAEKTWRKQERSYELQKGWLAGWQPVVYSKTAARLLKAAWCLLRIATPYAVLRRLTEVAVRPAAGVLSLNQSLSVLLLRHIHFLF